MNATMPAPVAFRPAPALHARWLAVVTHTDPRYGGLSSAVPRGALEVTATGRAEVSLAAFCAPGEEFRPAGYEGADSRKLEFWPAARSAWLRSLELRRRFSARVEAADGVHIHGLWDASTAFAARTARRLGKPYIVSAHGMLEPWALANKRLKKLIYARLIEREAVAGATCLHALTHAEAAQYRAFGARNPIAVIPNAVDVPSGLSPEPFYSVYPQLRSRRIVLFLGRLHPKKGLDLLAEAWARVSPAHPEAHLVVAGPDTEGTAAKITATLAAAGVLGSVTFTGMLQGELKWSALAAAECFVLPSYSEGLSMGVLEAMGAAVPVIVTRNCNMPEVVRHGAGWEIEPRAIALTEALGQLLARDPPENKAMGQCGGYLVTSRYNSRYIAEQMVSLYEYARNGIPPTNVELLTYLNS